MIILRDKRFSRMKAVNNDMAVEIGKKAIKGLKDYQVSFKDKNLKGLVEWTKRRPHHYNSPKVNSGIESTYKRLGRNIMNPKLTDDGVAKTTKRENINIW